MTLTVLESLGLCDVFSNRLGFGGECHRTMHAHHIEPGHLIPTCFTPGDVDLGHSENMGPARFPHCKLAIFFFP